MTTPLLAQASYDPAAAVSQATSSLLAMTALDTTNLRLNFAAPGNGSVLVRMQGTTIGATTFPRILLGILDGATLRGRMTPWGQEFNPLATTLVAQEAHYVINGLTPGQIYTWDAAYGVDILLASTNLKYGGPNDATGADAFGAFNYEIWRTDNLLASTMYDPLTSATITSTSLSAMAAIDTTNLRLIFIAPASGNVMWRVRTQRHGSTTGDLLLGVMQSTTVIARQNPLTGIPQTLLATDCIPMESSGVVTGLTPGTSYTWDAAWATQVVMSAGGIKHGGPNDSTTNNCFGGTAFEIWAA